MILLTGKDGQNVGVVSQFNLNNSELMIIGIIDVALCDLGDS